ncbi:AraC family transcriptional regulator [Rouxiella chamberiensis]|uniref:AraC family transcriptional regulator n=1 Tax=Rouxiella chamberiensis TaxID=1513468 RepID=UPI0005D40FF0|nr:helix-turn-helix domain-containing protein [Rouxiella chamberiensis]
MSDIFPPLTPKIRPEQPWFVLSAAKYYSAMPSADPAISHFYNFEVAASVKHTFAIPDGCVDIVFDCDAQVPTARVCGTTLKAREVEFISGHRYFGVRFSPGVIPDFIDLDAEELTDREFSFLDAIPNARLAQEQISGTALLSEKISLFNQYFTYKLIRKPTTVTSISIQNIIEKKGNIRIDQLESLTGYTCRTIQRQFRQDTGLSPKAFSRIIRCQSALNAIHEGKEMAMIDLAFDLGFSDQSHFLREFKQLVSTTPQHYQRTLTQNVYHERIIYR